ncbi:TetR/AcrR family transcriptional regulator [Streptomyces sp. NRRL S-340]|uniref:TetR/AcrR family transcriptional regulator n=1 Tax=Streptomyces sp. NRRL S-340 TaxID=1463901 RepID=UPI0006893D66|nr:TetR/AcrR family transcriptional regulator [Streptomyces sp. NRRL S-340]
MAYDAEDTRRRIFAAAAAEFADRGLAGARVDRIAAAARANKQAIYLYYGNKEKLFAAVLRAKLAEISVSISVDPDAVAESVGQLFDWYQHHPELIRLLLWEALETCDGVDEACGGADEAAGARTGGDGGGTGGLQDEGERDGERERELRDAFREKAYRLMGDGRGGGGVAPGLPEDARLRVAQDLLFTLMGLIAWNFAVPGMCRTALGEPTYRAALARRRATVIETARTLAATAGRLGNGVAEQRGPG